MTSTTVAQHPTQPLNFGPEWLRALSTPDSTTTPIPSSGGSGSGNIFKFSATKYRYSKDEILALRANVTERLAEEVRNEIMENLKDVESVFRPNIIEPLALTTPSTEETAKMNSLSSYISGRTPGGGGRGGGNNSQPSQQQQNDLRNNRGGGTTANGRGGSRGRGGRDNTYGPNRGNNNPEDNGENGGGGGGDDSSVSSSSWSRGGFPTRGGGSFGNRVRSYDDREQSQSFRRGGGTRQPSEGWRRSRGDEDENPDQNEESSTPANNSASWTSRGGPTRRGGGIGGSMENRTKSNDKWNYNDDRPGPSNSYESNQQRGWRSNATVSDRDLPSRRPQTKRDRMPEWMDDNNDGDNHLSSATFEQDGTFTGSSSLRQNNNDNNSNEQHKLQSQTSSDETSSRGNNFPSKQQQQQEEDNKHGKSTPPQADTAVVNIPTVLETIVPEPPPPVQHSMATWDDEFEPSDVAKTVVESTLAEDHDYSPSFSTYPTSRPISMEPTSPPVISQQRVQHPPPPPPPPVIIDDKQWFYKDPQNTVQGPFSSADMERWFAAGYFTILLPVKRMGETQFSTIQQLTKELGRLPFRTDIPSHPTPVQQPIAPESQKFNPMTYATPSTANNAYIDEYLMQQQQQQQSRQNVQHSMLFNRQTSVPSSTTDRKSVTSPPIISPQLQAYFASQQPHQQQSSSSSSLFTSNLVTDPAIVYQQQQPQLQRSISATNQQPSYDEIQRSFRQISSQPNTSSFFGTNIPMSQSQLQQPDDIMTRLTQAMQSHGQQQLEKVDELRRFDQQRREIELERAKLAQQAEQLRLQHEEEERRKIDQQQLKLEEELRKKKESAINKQMIFDQMKEMAKTIDQKKQQQQQQQQQVKTQPKVETDPFLAFQQSLQFQKEQQAKIDAQKTENVRRYQQQQLREQSHPIQQQQQLREQSHPIQQQQQQQLREQSQPVQQQTFKLPETANWARHSSQSNDQSQPLNFAEIQKQEQEQERRAREAAIAAQQLAKSEALNIPNPSSSSSSSNKPGSWARTLFAGNSSGIDNVSSTSSHILSDHDTNENALPESPITSYNQQATHAPKSRPATNQSSTPWNAANNTTNTSLQDIQRQQQQQSQSEAKQQQQQPQAQPISSGHSTASTPAWGGIFQHSTPTPQSTSSIFWGDNQPSLSSNKPAATSGNKPSTPWTELKSTAASSTTTKSNSAHGELSKSEREAKYLFTTTRTQDALSKWTQTQFKDNLQAIDVPTLVQLLKDIDTAEEIVEYVQPYIGSNVKAKEFANDFITKRKQLANAEPELDNESLNELAMAPTSSNANSGNTGDEGFQLASSNGQKKKAKKMKGQKIDVKQLGFMVNNRPEHRDDIDKVQM